MLVSALVDPKVPDLQLAVVIENEALQKNVICVTDVRLARSFETEREVLLNMNHNLKLSVYLANAALWHDFTNC